MFNLFNKLRGLKFIPLIILSFLYVTIFANSKSVLSTIKSNDLTIKPEVVKLALKAHETASRLHQTATAIATIIDFSLPSNVKRLWVIDTQTGRILYNTWVTHGASSGKGPYAVNFSNQANSHASSIGVYQTGASYTGGNGYSLYLTGLDKGFNDNAYDRHVVFHGASYASAKFVKKYGLAGHSWGCFAIAEELNKQIIDTIKNNSIVVAYYPNKDWLHDSKYL